MRGAGRLRGQDPRLGRGQSLTGRPATLAFPGAGQSVASSPTPPWRGVEVEAGEARHTWGFAEPWHLGRALGIRGRGVRLAPSWVVRKRERWELRETHLQQHCQQEAQVHLVDAHLAHRLERLLHLHGGPSVWPWPSTQLDPGSGPGPPSASPAPAWPSPAGPVR